jgi:hypothetical protein
MSPKFPNVQVQLTGQDGNAFAILGKVKSAMRRAKVSKEDIDTFIKEATSGDYDHLIVTCINYVDVR